jgi:LPXTG-motif cell wall-anchored protein
MDISFNLSVEDEIVATEHVWRTEWDPGNTPPEWNPPVPLNDEPEEEIIEDEPVPLAQAPATGGISTVFAIAAAVSGMGLAGIAFIGKRRDEE